MLEEGLFVVPARPILVGRADGAPPVPAFKPLFRVPGIDDAPAFGPGAEPAVEISDQGVVGPGRAFVGRRQVGFHVGARPHDDLVSAFLVRHGVERLLNGVKGRLPAAAVRVIAQLGHVKRHARAGFLGGSRGWVEGRQRSDQRQGQPISMSGAMLVFVVEFIANMFHKFLECYSPSPEGAALALNARVSDAFSASVRCVPG